MAPRRQREAAAPRQAANAGRRNQTGAAAAARSCPRNQAAAAAPSGSRNQTAATAATPTGRPHARNREANRRRLTRNLSAQPNAAAADDENTIAPAETDTIVVDHLMKDADVAEAVATLQRVEDADVAEAVATFQRVSNQIKTRHEELIGDLEGLRAMIKQFGSEKEAEVQKVMEELESERAQKEAQVQKVMKLESEKAQKETEVQKVMEENVRLHAMLDKKEAQLQAMNEQCKFMALNHQN